MRPTRRNRLRVLIAVITSVVLTGALLSLANPSANAATVDTNAWYVLVNRTSGKALDVYNLATNDGARITQWARNNGNQQQWQFVDSG
ncbi:RICIN domain-containing protein, partial [Streptosporangium sp. G11]|uniref:RICIN domain-containing protein n=1 Tax=Streptosporangium sp. G11 TaxID=3436926 RepID=UPI003EBBFDAD